MKNDVEIGAISQEQMSRAAIFARNRFPMLDGIRGLAAIAVVLYHSFGGNYFINGALAVDLFFIMSGFVISHSYDGRLRERGQRKIFLKKRFVRLYPLLFIGSAGGLSFGLAQFFGSHPDTNSLIEILFSGFLSLLAIPYLFTGSINIFVFSFNPPLWSLFFEIFANVAYVFMSNCKRRSVLFFLIAGSLILVSFQDSLGGDTKQNFLLGFPRVTAGFFIGVCINIYLNQLRRTVSQVRSILVAALVVMIFIFPIKLEGAYYIPAMCFLSGIVCIGTNTRPSKFDGCWEFLGIISYPIYILQNLTLWVFMYLGKKFGISSELFIELMSFHLVALIVLSFLTVKFYESPMRNFLTKRLIASNYSYRTRAVI
ncbi:acyltransferase family protein [Methylobacterium mesophilicum]